MVVSRRDCVLQPACNVYEYEEIFERVSRRVCVCCILVVMLSVENEEVFERVCCVLKEYVEERVCRIL